MRLIDADELRRMTQEPTMYDINVSDVLSLIDDCPTAYDVEAVVQRLEWLKNDDYECEENGCQGEFCIQCTLDKAIEIVRGGRNE